MTDAIIRTSSDYTLNLNGETATVTAHTYHLARATSHADTTASLTLLPGKWIVAATQSEPGNLPGDTLRTLVQHVASIHGPLRVADDGSVPEILEGAVLAAKAGGDPEILEGAVLAAKAGGVSYSPPEARDQDITRHGTR